MEEFETGYWTPESIEEFFSDFEEMAPTPEELEAEERSQRQMIRDEEIGEMYNSQFAFD